MIDIFYVIGTGSKWQNNELRYSLRSLEMFGKNIKDVYIVGNKPYFINDKIKWIETYDIGYPSVNHWYKVRKFFKTTNIDKAVYMMDDVFFTKEVDFDNYPLYQRGDLVDIPNDGDSYHKCLINTKNELKDMGKNTINFEVHCPIIYERNKFLNLTDIFNTLRKKHKNFVGVRSLYANYYNMNGPFTKDVKIRGRHMDDMTDKMNKIDCFSIGDEVIEMGMDKILQEKYPNKSKFEK